MYGPRFEIVQEDMGGWARVFLGRGEPTGELAKYLSHGLTDWMRKRPHLRVRLPVPGDGVSSCDPAGSAGGTTGVVGGR